MVGRRVGFWVLSSGRRGPSPQQGVLPGCELGLCDGVRGSAAASTLLNALFKSDVGDRENWGEGAWGLRTVFESFL